VPLELLYWRAFFDKFIPARSLLHDPIVPLPPEAIMATGRALRNHST
jgi:hypothetical protein